MKFLIFLMGLISFSAPAFAEININGFGGMYGGVNLSSDGYVSEFKDKSPAFAPFSNLGLNIGSRLSDQIQIQTQFEISGERAVNGEITPQWELYANWAFISFAVTPEWKIKVGRQLYPDWLAAEFIDVGFLQPYRELPDSVEGLSPYKAFDGVLIEHIWSLGDLGNLSMTVFGGRAQTDISSNGNSAKAVAKNFLGSSLTLKGDAYKLRAQLNRASGEVSGSALQTHGSNQYGYTLGVSYDAHNIVVWSEYGKVRSNDRAPGLVPGSTYFDNSHAFYILGGYRFGPFLPRYMWIDADYTDLGVGYGRSFTHDLGVNYQISDQVILKVDFLIEQFKAVSSIGIAGTGRPVVLGATSATALTAGVDFIF